MVSYKKATAVLGSALVVYLTPGYAQTPSNEDLYRIIHQQNQRIESLAKDLRDERAGSAKPAQPASASQAPESKVAAQKALESKVEAQQAQIEALAEREPNSSLLDRVNIGGYGSVRAEANNLDNQNNTFTFRRFVLSADAQVTDRLQTYLELEFERFTELELEKDITTGDEFETKQAIEGANGSEISFEQAWAGYSINPAFNLRAGILLVPLGRFNENHDDNQWNLTRRTLVDTGVSVLPSPAAFSELGAGFTGIIPFGEQSLIDYSLYVVNGAQLDFANETEVESAPGEPPESKIEAEFAPSRGSASQDSNDNKAVTGRIAYRWRPSQEIAVSGYHGRYTPDFLTDASVTSIGLDGLNKLGGLEIEYEAIYTAWSDVDKVAADFARTAVNRDGQGTEIALAGNSLADSRAGYWVELRYPFWSQALDGTFLKRGFSNPQLEPTLRFEQVYFNDQLRGFEFANGNITESETFDATLNRATLGIAYRPIPSWVISLAGEYTWTNQDSLAGLTNFIPAGENEDDEFALTAGVAFGF